MSLYCLGMTKERIKKIQKYDLTFNEMNSPVHQYLTTTK